MRSLIAAIKPVGIAAFGGGFAVFGGYDDSPGATLLGALIVLGAIVFAARATTRREQDPSPA
jgi:hypothetical protein